MSASERSLDETVPLTTGAPPPLSVSEAARRIKTALETRVGSIRIHGEISNFRQPQSGHWYFTLKDAEAQINAVMFRRDQAGVAFRPADGAQVIVQGAVTLYEKDGRCQIILRLMEAAGRGSLQARFEALKARLLKEGLFEASRKRPLPLLPRRVGLVTSPTGAAIRDILSVIARRFPNLHLVLVPVRVQGEGAATEIAAAIDLLNTRGGYDVLIVGRGGGSLEDLWAFNEEPVARAIARSAIPIISAVGHEIDFTIADFVADVRAPTPSAAAELLVGRKDEFEARIRALDERLRRILAHGLTDARHRLKRASGSWVFREPAHALTRQRQRIETLRTRAAHALERRARDAQQQVDELAVRMRHGATLRRQTLEQRLARLAAQLKTLSPLGVLERGYSITQTADGRLVTNCRQVEPGETLRTRVHDGALLSTISVIEPAPAAHPSIQETPP